MKNYSKWFLVFLFTMISSVAFASNLTPEMIEGMILELDRAVVAKDAEAIVSLMSEDVSLAMNITMNGKTKVFEANRKEYLSNLKESWEQFEDYTYTRKNLHITMYNNGAIASGVVYETMRIQGQQLSSTTEEEVTIALVGGKPLVTKVMGFSKIALR